MAGGKGKRLLPLTKKIPKAMVKVFGKPMLEHIIINAKKCGFRNFIISINYIGKKIKNYFKSGSKLDIKINYIEEKKPLGTAGSLYHLKKNENQTVLVSNCDIISDADYGDIIDYHRSNKALATMVVRRYENRNPYGVISTKGNRFLAYDEKPFSQENINAGIYVFESKVFKFLKKDKYFDMTELFIYLEKKKKKVIVYPIYENWQDFGQKNK